MLDPTRIEWEYRPDVNVQALCAPFPDELIESRQMGNDGEVPYIAYATVLYRLISATNNQFSFTVVDEREENGRRVCLGRLAIPGLGVREQYGVTQTASSTGKAMPEDMAAKGAASDALKKCAEAFGVGLQLKRGGTTDPPPGHIFGPMTKAQYTDIAKAVAAAYPEHPAEEHRAYFEGYVRERYGEHRLHPKVYLNEAEARDVCNHFRVLALDSPSAPKSDKS